MSVSRRFLQRLAFVVGLLGLASAVQARPATGGFAPLGPETSTPYGWVDFCQRHAEECDETAAPVRAVNFTAAAMKKIVRVNVEVNRLVKPVSDKEHFGVVDAWDFPEDGMGDCEDYALLKRRVLIAAGFPRSALLLSVVKDEHGDGHSVLLVRTTRGDYVLDNLENAVKPWSETPYRFVKRQSQENQNVWVAIGEPTSAPAYVSK